MKQGAAVGRKKVRWWNYLVAIAVVLWLALIVYFYQNPRNAYEPTGDELFDRLAMLILEQSPEYSNLAGRLYLVLPKLRPEANIDYSQINDWEADFSDDPRYWQLRWYCSNRSSTQFNASAVSEQSLDVISKMEEGVVDAGSYYAIDFYELYEVDPKKAVKLAAKGVESEPDNAYFHYLLAGFLIKDGKVDAALEELKAGNNAPRYSSAGVYPLSFVVEHPEWFVRGGNQVVGGEITLFFPYPVMYLLLAKQLVNNLLQQGTGITSAETLDELMEYSRRFQKQDSRSIINGLTSTFMVGEVLEHFKGSGSVLNPEQQKEINEIERAKKILIGEFRKQSKLSDAIWQSTGQYESEYKGRIRAYEGYASEREFLEQNQLFFDLVEPPLFTIWASGKTAGILDKAAASESAQP